MASFSLLSPLSALGHLWQDKTVSLILRWNLVLIVIQLAYLFLQFNVLPPQVPLFYSLPWGEPELAGASSLFLLPLLSLVIFLLNSVLAAIFLKPLRLLSRLLFIFSLIFALLSSVSLLRIISLIT